MKIPVCIGPSIDISIAGEDTLGLKLGLQLRPQTKTKVILKAEFTYFGGFFASYLSE